MFSSMENRMMAFFGSYEPLFACDTYQFRDYSRYDANMFRGEAHNEVGDGKGLRTLFDIPSNETVMAVISLGYRAEEPKRPERRPLSDIVKFFRVRNI